MQYALNWCYRNPSTNSRGKESYCWLLHRSLSHCDPHTLSSMPPPHMLGREYPCTDSISLSLSLSITECSKSAQCVPLKHHYDECAERVTAQEENPDHKGPKEDCVEECEFTLPSSLQKAFPAAIRFYMERDW